MSSSPVVSSHVQAKSRVLESICTGIRERYKALSLPPELALPEPQAVDVVADMTHPDQRAIGAAGRKVLAMFETISQFCQKAQQVMPLSMIMIIVATIITIRVIIHSENNNNTNNNCNHDDGNESDNGNHAFQLMMS